MVTRLAAVVIEKLSARPADRVKEIDKPEPDVGQPTLNRSAGYMRPRYKASSAAASFSRSGAERGTTTAISPAQDATAARQSRATRREGIACPPLYHAKTLLI